MATRRIGNININYTPSEASTQMWDAIGRTEGGNAASGNNDNFFAKRGNSIENAIGTTLAAPASFVYDQLHNARTENLLEENKNKLNDIAKKYGYDSMNSVWDARDAAEETGDTAKVAEIDNTVAKELQTQASANVDTMKKNADDYRDYRENNYISQKINQDPGKFAGSAINTWNTMADVLLPGAGVGFNAVQGAAEGVADELEQNGFENFDWGRAGQNALIGGVTGGVVGKFNQGLTNSLAKRAAAKGIENTQKGLVKTVATGVGRGALSGAVGGATGAGMSSILNRTDVGQGIANTLQGALQGAQSGALSGGVMAGANALANKTPGVKNVMQGINQATEDWKNSGNNFGERLSNTWNSGESGTANAIKDLTAKINNSSLRNLGNSIEDVSAETTPQDIQNMNVVNNTQTQQPSSWDRLAQEGGYANYDELVQKFAEANPGAKIDAGTITTWMDENPGNWNPNMPTTETVSSEYGESDLATGKTKSKNILSKAGRAMQAAQANATRKETRDIGIKNAGDLLNTVRSRTGISDIETQAELASELTGGKDSILDKVQRDVLSTTKDGKVRTVDLTDLTPKINKIIDDAPNTLINASQKAKIKEGIMADLTNGGIDTITKANNFRASANQLFAKNQRTPDKADVVEGKIYSQIADLVDDKSYSSVPKEDVDILFQKAENELAARAQTAKNNGNQKVATAYNNLKEEYQNSPRTIQNYRSLKKDFVDVNKLYTKTAQGSTAWNNGTLTMGAAVMGALASGNPLLAVPTAIATKTLAPAAGEVATKAAATLGGKIADVGDKISTKTQTGATTTPTTPKTGYSTPSTQVYNAIGRTSGETAGENVAGNYISQAAQESEPVTLESMAGTPTNADATSVYNSIYGNSGATTTPSDYYSGILQKAMDMAIADGNANAYVSLLSMYNDYAQNQAKTDTTQSKLTATQQRANAAATSLARLEKMTPDLGYNLSNIPVVGDLATLGGNDYESEAKSLAQQIGYMVSGANIKEEEAYNIGKAYVPQPFDSEQTRRNKLQRAREIIARYQQSYAE